MKIIITFLIACIPFIDARSQAIPAKYTELLKFVQMGPDQGDTASCLFVGSTGAMELIANKRHNIVNPKPYGPYDLAESYLMHAPDYTTAGKTFWEQAVLKFNRGFGIHIDDWSFEAWNDTYENRGVWNYRSWNGMRKVPLPKLETIRLFAKGNRWSTSVLTDADVQKVKEALWRYKSPVLINYNDNHFWHVVTIVGYDDNLPGICYDSPARACPRETGAFYVRDSFGMKVEVRNYGWFKAKGNAAFVVKEAQ